MLTRAGSEEFCQQASKGIALTELSLTCRFQKGALDALCSSFGNFLDLQTLHVHEAFLGVEAGTLEALAQSIPDMPKVHTFELHGLQDPIEDCAVLLQALQKMRNLTAVELGLHTRSPNADERCEHLHAVTQMLAENTSIRHLWLEYSGGQFMTSHECRKLLACCSDADPIRLWKVREAAWSWHRK